MGPPLGTREIRGMYLQCTTWPLSLSFDTKQKYVSMPFPWHVSLGLHWMWKQIPCLLSEILLLSHQSRFLFQKLTKRGIYTTTRNLICILHRKISCDRRWEGGHKRRASKHLWRREWRRDLQRSLRFNILYDSDLCGSTFCTIHMHTAHYIEVGHIVQLSWSDHWGLTFHTYRCGLMIQLIQICRDHHFDHSDSERSIKLEGS